MEECDDLFSFKGRVGLARFWKTFLATGAAAFIIDAFFPVSEGQVEIGSSTLSFPTAENWMVLAVRLVLTAPLIWILVATIVKRLHDLGRSGKWLAALPIIIFVLGILDATLSSLGLQESPRVIIFMILLLPICPIGAWVMFEVFFLPPKRPTNSAKDASQGTPTG